MKGPTLRQFEKVRDVSLRLLLYSLSASKESEPSVQELEAIDRYISEAMKRIAGNRHGDAVATWADLRLLIEATIRKAQEILEGT